MGVNGAVHITWQIGVLRQGNGTIGASNRGYIDVFNSVDYIIVRDTSDGGYGCPILPQDPYVGQSYAADLLKHFARIRYHKIVLHADTSTSATTGNVTFAIAPTSGASQVGFATQTGTSTAVVLVLGAVEALEGSKTIRAWDNVSMDMTKYIAGGSGPKQNEFDINQGFNSTIVSGTSGEFRDVVPCCFVVGGQGGTDGSIYHNVWAEAWVELIDFLAADVPSNVARRSVLERQTFRERRAEREAAIDRLLAATPGAAATDPVAAAPASDAALARREAWILAEADRLRAAAAR